MLRKTKASMLTLATILAAGCAHSDYGSKARKNARWALLDQPKNQNVQEVPEPKILPKTYFEAARLLEQEGEFGAAITQYRKAIAVNHNFVGAYHRLGMLLNSMGLHDEAFQLLSKATMLAPDNVVVRNNYGFALMVNQRWEEAAVQFRRCTELQPQFTRAYVNLGMTLTRLDRFDEALATFRMVLPEPDAYYNLGLMYRGLGRYDDAAESFRNALAANPAFLAARAELNDIAARLSPEVEQPRTVVTAIPLGRGADRESTHPTPMPPDPQANAMNETSEVVGVEAPVLIADSMDAKDAADNPEIAAPERPPVGPTRTRDTLIALQPDNVYVDRTAETDTTPPIKATPAISTTKPTPQSDAAPEQREEPRQKAAEDAELAPNAAAQPPVAPALPTPQQQRPTEIVIAAEEPQPTTETIVTEIEMGPTIAELYDVKPRTIAEHDTPAPAEKVTTMPEVAQAETERKTPIDDDRRGIDDSPFPRPNMDPAYVIIGPTEIDPALEKMRLVKEREAKVRKEREQFRMAQAIHEAVHVAKAERPAADELPEIVTAGRVAEETTPPDGAIENSSSLELITEPILFSLADEPVRADIPATDETTRATLILCELNDVTDISPDATPAINQPRPGRLDPADSEAIIAAFERHLRSFSSDDPCWDEIDWQVWDVIDPTQFAASEIIAAEKLAALAATRQAKEAEEDASFLRGEIRPDIAVLIREAWMDAASFGEPAKPRADPLAGSDSDDLHFVDQNEPLPDDVVSSQTATAPLNRRAAFHDLARRLDDIRGEISCWDEVLSFGARTATTPGPKTSMTNTKEPARPAILPPLDIEAEMTERMPPFERSNLDLLADRLPLVLDRSCVDLTMIVPSSLPPVAEVTPSGSFAAPQVVSIRSTAAGLPILVREERIEPCPPYGFEPSPASQASSQPTVEFDWQATFGLLDDVISIVLNETVCLESLAANSATPAGADKTETAEPRRANRPTLASTIVKPTGR